MRRYLCLLITVFILSCNTTVSDNELKHLNGYWEIEQVVMPDGTEKQYTVNPAIDYFEIKGKEGLRRKVVPQFDGTYRMNGLSEKIAVIEDGNKTYIKHTTEYAEWKEQILELDDKRLVLKNEQDIEYHYKKPQSFSIK